MHIVGAAVLKKLSQEATTTIVEETCFCVKVSTNHIRDL